MSQPIRMWAAVALSALVSLPAHAQETLRIYLIDVEGGGATLFVSPTGETLLVDTGNGGAAAGRDASRIIEAMRDAGVRRIDHLLTTHWHGDHYGAMAELASRVPVDHFIDHGPSVESNAAAESFLRDVYPALVADARRTVVSPGDRIAIDGLDVTVVASAKRTIDRPLPGAGDPNPHCDSFVRQTEDEGENAQSVGIAVQLGRFRALHLGDLTANTEFDLMCPNDPIGPVDVWVVSHHGQPTSNTPVLVHAIRPRVAIMNNGTRKGGQPEAMRVIHSAPGLEDLWQLHFSELSGQEYTVPGMFIANDVDEPIVAMPIAPLAGGRGAPPRPPHDGTAHWILVSAEASGAFVVTNDRNGFTKRYP